MTTPDNGTPTNGQAGMAAQYTPGVGTVLERMRRKLLDLSAKNPLLNYRHPKGRSLRVVDEVASQLFERLVEENPMYFAPLIVPRELSGAHGAAADDDTVDRKSKLAAKRSRDAGREARARTVAVEKGINPSYELPLRAESSRHRDDEIQTLREPEELEELLRKMEREAKTYIQEQGANRLYLMFGFVEWAEMPTSEEDEPTRRLAPLILLPVQISREAVIVPHTRTFRYKVTLTGEDWDVNVTLREKCKTEFGFEFPDIDEDESLDAYLHRVKQWLENAPNGWSLKIMVTLGFVSFGKILMWHDLDPRRWPNDSFFKHDPIGALLGDRSTADNEVVYGGSSLVEEYHIDNEPESTLPPTIVDADSSQHSALIDALRGRDIVIQGPPGTGKSQTITNLVAAAIADGKRVLFVAEKRAALDVVHRRLKQTGLGPFVLALHSHTAQKRELLDDLNQRIELANGGGASWRIPTAPPAARDRKRLNDHVGRLHGAFGGLGASPFTILWRARRLIDQLPMQVRGRVEHLRIPNAEGVTSDQLAETRDAVDDFAAIFDDVLKAGNGDIKQHPWHGVQRSDISSDSAQELIELSRELKRALTACIESADAIESQLGVDVDAGGIRDRPAVVDCVDLARAIAARCVALQPPRDNLPPDLVSTVARANSRHEYRVAIDAVGEARMSWAKVAQRWGHHAAIPRADVEGAARTVSAARTRFGAKQTIEDLVAIRTGAKELSQRLRSAEVVVAECRNALGVAKHAPSAPDVHVRFAVVLASLLNISRDLDELILAVRGEGLTTVGAMDTLQTLSNVAGELRSRRDVLEAQFNPIVRPSERELHEAVKALSVAWPGPLALLQSGYRDAKRTYRVMAAGESADRTVMLRGMHSVLSHQRALREFSERQDLRRVFGTRANGIDSPFALAQRAAVWYQSMQRVSRDLGPEHANIFDQFWAAPSDRLLQVMQRVDGQGAIAAAMAVPELGHQLEWRIGEVWAELIDTPLATVQRRLADVADAIAAVERLQSALAAPASASLEELADHLVDLDQAFAADDEARRHASVFASAGIPFAGPTTDVAALQDALAYLEQVDALDFPHEVATWLCGTQPHGRAKWLKDACRELTLRVDELETRIRAFRSQSKLDETDWLTIGPQKAAAFALSAATFGQQLDRLDRALVHEKSLHRWAQHLRSREAACAAGAKAIVELVESRQIDAKTAADAHEAALYCTLAAAVFSRIPELDEFAGVQHEQVRTRFQLSDVQDLTRTQVTIAQRLNSVKRHHGASYAMRVGDLSDEALIKHEASKKTRHIAIRELFRRAGAAISALKPCVMMGPQAVAQFLRAGQFEFDLLVMDEASQMRPEDALGAIARAKQVVIVGDPMQLGPSAFFDAQSDGFDEDEDYLATEVEPAERDTESVESRPPRGLSILERSESILTAAAQRYPVRMLRWHYRSRHPKLIAFSNREFYNGRLIVFPTANEGATAEGVVFTRVEDAVYGEQRNPAEAERIVDAVLQHARATPDRSLMVATMNLHQADLIDQLLERAEKSDPALAAFRGRHAETPEPFEVKNLENVQGDERDVVMVSVTAGPDLNGKLSLTSFGAVTKRGGERRLNVLFTRARQRTEVFCSFDPAMIQAEGKSEGVRVMREYLLYAADAKWAVGTQSGRAADSDFEIAVTDALRAHGWEVHTQVGIAGYFIDLAIAHPDHPGRYLLGVECDGAAYHSAKSARDRDRLRQTVLEGLGWRIHRIWSTDWFRDPVGQAARVTEVAQKALTEDRRAEAELQAHRSPATVHAASTLDRAVSSSDGSIESRDDMGYPPVDLSAIPEE